MNQQKFYEELLKQQYEVYTLLVYGMAGITVVLMGGITLWNFYLYKRRMNSEIEKAVKKNSEDYFDKKMKEFSTKITQEFKDLETRNSNGIIYINGENARLFANFCYSNNLLEDSIDWWFCALEEYIKLDNHELIRMSVSGIKNIFTEYGIEKFDHNKFNNIDSKIHLINEKISNLLKDEKVLISKNLQLIKKKINQS